IIGYGIVLIAYFNIQFLIHRKEPNPQELRKIRKAAEQKVVFSAEIIQQSNESATFIMFTLLYYYRQ
ncbi:hypothetical protein AKJ53_01165, partial [candidate division MSBL1 archaeon SCGC-AAA382F02]